MKFAIAAIVDGKPQISFSKELLTERDKTFLKDATDMGVEHERMFESGRFGEIDVATAQKAEPFVDLEVAPGENKWYTIFIKPNTTLYAHRTDSIDYDTILKGEVTLLLEDSEMTFQAGDSVVIGGVKHGWRGGPEGCYLTTLNFGVPPRKN